MVNVDLEARRAGDSGRSTTYRERRVLLKRKTGSVAVLMSRIGLRSFGGGLFVGFSLHAAIISAWPKPTVAVVDDEEMAEVDRLGRFGLPSNGPLRRAGDFIACLDVERRIPRWVLEFYPPTPSDRNHKDGNREKSTFFGDPHLPAFLQASSKDYAATGYSRGHLAPAHMHTASQEFMDATFNLNANIVPQESTFNVCDWYRLESMTKRLAKNFPGGMWVVTGPCFVPKEVQTPEGNFLSVSYRVLGKHHVAVPTHMYKVLLGVEASGVASIEAFMMPNEPITELLPISTYIVKLQELEAITGLQFFPKVPMSSVYPMCKRFRCEGTANSFESMYRVLAQIKKAPTLEVASTLAEGIRSADGKLPPIVAAELKRRHDQNR